VCAREASSVRPVAALQGLDDDEVFLHSFTETWHTHQASLRRPHHTGKEWWHEGGVLPAHDSVLETTAGGTVGGCSGMVVTPSF
jgi:hypothetical protein